MPAPSTYTEEQLAQFMHSTLATTASVLDWTVGAGSYAEAVSETLLAYGVSDIADATDIRRLRALARLELWRAVMAATAAYHDAEEDQQALKRAQIHNQAVKQYELARLAVAALDNDTGGGGGTGSGRQIISTSVATEVWF